MRPAALTVPPALSLALIVTTWSCICNNVADGAAFAEYDYQMNHDLALASGNNVFVLMMNGFRGLYSRIGGYFFSHDSAQQVARNFYKELLEVAEQGKYEEVPLVVRNYGIESGKVWLQVREDMPKDLVD